MLASDRYLNNSNSNSNTLQTRCSRGLGLCSETMKCRNSFYSRCLKLSTVNVWGRTADSLPWGGPVRLSRASQGTRRSIPGLYALDAGGDPGPTQW